MNLLEMSVTGGLWIAVAMFLRQILGTRLPPWMMPALWWTILLRLLVPVSIPSPVGIFRSASGSPVPAAPVLSGTAGGQLPTAVGAGAAQAAPDLLPVLWGVGAVLCLGTVLWHWRRGHRIFSQSVPVREPAAQNWLAAHPTLRPIQIRQSDRISSPLTYGLFRPVILLPAWQDWSQAELECVLTHEFVHIRHLDNLTKAAALLTACLHWFNPLVWCLVLLVSRDLELFCDWQTTRLLGQDGRKRYALALLQMEAVRDRFPSPFSYFTTHPLSERIETLMKRNKISLAATALAMVAMFAAGAIFTTQAQAKYGTQGQSTSAAQQGDTQRQQLRDGSCLTDDADCIPQSDDTQQTASQGQQLRDGSCLTDDTDCVPQSDGAQQTASQGQQLRDGSCLTDDTDCVPQSDDTQQTASQGQQLRDGSCLTDDTDCVPQSDGAQQAQTGSSGSHRQDAHQHHGGQGHH